MLTSIRQVNGEFFRIFHGLEVMVGDKMKPIPSRYARKSSMDYVEETENQIYPCVAIQDFSPNPKKEWFIDMHAYFGGVSLDGLMGYMYQRPVWMEFRYDVSIASKSYNEYLSLKDYFMSNFVYGKRFIFNRHLTGEDEVGDIVPYTVRDTDIPRTDGVYETNYEFTLSVWLYPKQPEGIDVVQKVIINLYQNNTECGDTDFLDSDSKAIYTIDGGVIDTRVFRSKFSAETIERILSTAIISNDFRKAEVKTEEEYEKLIEKDKDTIYFLADK